MENETTKTNEVDYKAEFERLQNDYAKLKGNFDKTSSEVADYKRKERERMGDEEKREAEMQEREAYYKKLEKENAVHRYTAKMSNLIKDEKTLNEVATLMAEGNYDKAIEKQMAYLEKERAELEKTIKADLMRQNPQPTPQSGGKSMTKQEIMAIKDPVERQQAIARNITLFQ